MTTTPSARDRTGTTDLARYIQHTLIEPGVGAEQIVRHCAECVEYGFDAAMVPAVWVALSRERLSGTGVTVATAVDFPIGGMTTAGRVAEVRAAVAAGAEEIDVGTQIGKLRSGLADEFVADLAAVVEAAGVPVKAILELPLLEPDERELAVALAVEAGVTHVKNASSGAVGVATVAHVRYLKERTPPHVKIKASGGISTPDHARALIDAGADLIGTSSGVALVTANAQPARGSGSY